MHWLGGQKIKGQGHAVVKCSSGKGVHVNRTARFFSASLSISIASGALMLRAYHLAHLSVGLSVCLSVCPISVLWQNG